MRRKASFIPGAGAEQLQQETAALASLASLGQDARYNTLRKDPTAKTCYADIRNPMAPANPQSYDTAVADARISIAELEHLAGQMNRTTG
ncbi:MAG TPA: hypothetical protein VMR97_07920 [Acidimicrobiales bacterium]|nr:hypothetical protein [Acidimicrobiales bacterium]